MKKVYTRSKRLVIVCVLLLIAILIAPHIVTQPNIAHAATTVVTINNVATELFPELGGTAPTSNFVVGPGAPPAGVGSLTTSVTLGGYSKIALRRGGYHGVAFSNFNSVSYSTFMDPTSTKQEQWYVNIYLDSNGDSTRDCRLDYIPAGPFSTVNWQNWTIDDTAIVRVVGAGVAPLCANSAGMTIAAFKALYPAALFNAFNNPADFQIRFNMGDTAGSYQGYVGAIDNLTIDVTGVGNDTWDLEPIVPPPPAPPAAPGSDTGSTDSAAPPPQTCLDEFLKNVNATSPGVLAECIKREVSNRPNPPTGLTYLSPAYIIQFQGSGAAVVCFNTVGLPHPVRLGFFDGTQWNILLTIETPGIHCMTIDKGGFAAILIGTGVSFAPAEALFAETPLNNCTVITNAIMNLRGGPGLQFGVLALVPFGNDGTSLQALARVDVWFRVNFNGQSGWLNSGFLRLRGDCTG